MPNNISINDTVKLYPKNAAAYEYALLCEYPAKVINIEFDPETNEVEWVGLEFDFYIDEKIKEKLDRYGRWFSVDACNHTGTLGKCAWYNINCYGFEKIS